MYYWKSIGLLQRMYAPDVLYGASMPDDDEAQAGETKPKDAITEIRQQIAEGQQKPTSETITEIRSLKGQIGSETWLKHLGFEDPLFIPTQSQAQLILADMRAALANNPEEAAA